MRNNLKTEIPAAPDWRSNPRTPRPKLPIQPDARLIFKHQLLELLDMAYPTIWAQMRDGKFPLPIALGPENGRSTRIAWFADEIYEWIATRPRRRMGRQPRPGEHAEAPTEKPRKKAARSRTPVSQ